MLATGYLAVPWWWCGHDSHESIEVVRTACKDASFQAWVEEVVDQPNISDTVAHEATQMTKVRREDLGDDKLEDRAEAYAGHGQAPPVDFDAASEQKKNKLARQESSSKEV